MPHTPAPWKWWSQLENTDRPQNYDLDKIVTEDGNEVILCIYGNQAKRKEPNLQLIAAAPELLEELETTLKNLYDFKVEIVLQDMIVPLWVNERIEKIELAIAKAKGEA